MKDGFYILGNSSGDKVIGKGFIKNGLHTGLWKYYNSNNELHTKGIYKRGRQVAVWIFNFDIKPTKKFYI